MRYTILSRATIAVVAGIVLIHGSVVAAEKSAKKPVRIYLLSGQSNMSGRGVLGDLNKPAAEQKATLVRFLKAPENLEKYKGLYSSGNGTRVEWAVRDDVFITMGTGKDELHGGLRPGYGGFRNKGFGPELGIGYVLGEEYEEAVLLVKVAFGANNLAVNFRPPSSGGQVGDKYPILVEALRNATNRLPELVPGYESGQGYKLAGFFWNQGEHDASEKFAPEYEVNLANLIRDLRKEFAAPEMPVVVAVTGCFGRDFAEMVQGSEEAKDAATKWWRMVRDAQLAISQRPEFKGNVATAETRDFWRPREEFGGNNQGIHWNSNGESYWLMGEAMGRAMLELDNAQKN